MDTVLVSGPELRFVGTTHLVQVSNCKSCESVCGDNLLDAMVAHDGRHEEWQQKVQNHEERQHSCRLK
jgi:hypothetical protein